MPSKLPTRGRPRGSTSTAAGMGGRIIAARLAKKLTQEQLARAVGVDRSMIVGYESGRVQPGIRVGLMLARVLGMTGEKMAFGGALSIAGDEVVLPPEA